MQNVKMKNMTLATRTTDDEGVFVVIVHQRRRSYSIVPRDLRAFPFVHPPAAAPRRLTRQRISTAWFPYNIYRRGLHFLYRGRCPDIQTCHTWKAQQKGLVVNVVMQMWEKFTNSVISLTKLFCRRLVRTVRPS